MRIHFVGIKGASMSILSEIAKHNGHIVSGSDIAINGHDENNAKGANLVVYSTAIPNDNVELAYAKKNGIPTLSRSEYLSLLSKEYENFFCVCGCHGKTTTTAMLFSVLKRFNPTLHIGAKFNDFLGEKRILISEACEYKKGFLSLNPDYTIFTNIDYDHPDTYKNIDEVKDAYLQFYKQSATSFINADDKQSKFLLKRKNTISYGFSSSSEFCAQSIKPTCNGYTFDLYYKSRFLSSFVLPIKGRHNVYNSLGAIACGFAYGLGKNDIVKGIAKFTPVNRRNEFLGTIDGCDIYTDYAHHPTEITSQLSSLTSFYKKVAIIFQPHTYSRTANLLSDFAFSLSKANYVVLIPTFASRESGSDNDNLYLALKDKVITEKLQKEEVNDWVKRNAKNFSCICYTGAGDIDEQARRLFEKQL